MRPSGQQAPYVFSHRSDQKPGYRQVAMRIFWSVLRYVFKNSARYIPGLLKTGLAKKSTHSTTW